MNAREVSLIELNEWVDKNAHRTWNWEGKLPQEKLTLEMKYLYFSFDTRDMKVFAISTDGIRKNIQVSTHEKFDGTILQLLEKKLDSQSEDGEK